MVCSEKERFVDVIARSDILFEKLNAFVDERHQGSVDYEACLVGGLDNGLSEGFYERCRGFDSIWGRSFSFDKLH